MGVEETYSERSLFGLEGKWVLITGASSGIGRATANIFALCGCRLLLLDIDELGLKKTLEGISFPDRHTVFCVDLGKKEKIDEFWGGIEISPEILINIAGVYPFQNYGSLSESEYQKTLDINMNSVFWMCQNFINRRDKMGGVIVNVASIEAILPFKQDLIPYCMSKSGVIALTRSIARDFGRKGFRANVVLPGAIKTPGTKSLVVEGIKKLRFDLLATAIDFQHRLALGRWGRPEEVAKVILFLASDLASYVQGALVPVDGGFLSS